MNNFEFAAKNKLRFTSGLMLLATEDLWDLPLTSRSRSSLDGVAKWLSREIKDAEEESFVVAKSSASATLTIKLDIVKYIIAVKLEEKETKAGAVAKKAQREKIMGMIAKKEDESFRRFEC